ncbi:MULTISPECIES: hypothetical protein [unclassified Microcoleus]|uniref:hypothetical protein n=1 Tax=unclassified Microcoleus TaxID=2642155 RepID=UPI002FD4E163
MGWASRPSHFQEWKLFNSHSLRSNIYLCIASFAVGDRNPSSILTLTPLPNLVAPVDYEYSSLVGDRPPIPPPAFKVLIQQAL